MATPQARERFADKLVETPRAAAGEEDRVMAARPGSCAHRRRSEAGVALIVSLAILSVVGMLILGAVLTTQVEMAVGRNDATAAQAQYIAQAGLQKYKAALFQNYRWLESGGATSGSSGSSTPNTDACYNSLAGGLNLTRTTGGKVTWTNNKIELPAENVTSATGAIIGSYVVTFLKDPNNASRVTVRSEGQTVDGPDSVRARSQATATFLIRNGSTLEQAIFAGSGSGMRFVNGNTTIYGGVYIVGDLGNPDTQVIEANGNLSILNGYTTTQSGNPSFLVSGARSAANLCAALRVQSGTIAMGGSSIIGKPDNRVLTVAVGRGLEDVSFERGGTLECKGNKGVCSEAGVTPFDLGEPPVYPMLDESPGTELCPSPTTWRTCIRDEATADGVVITTGGGSTVSLVSPSATLPGPCQTALNAAAASGTLVLDGADLDCTVVVDGVKSGFTYTPGRLDLFGNVNLRGLNLQFDRDVVYRATSRDDDGTLQRFANLSLEAIAGKGGTFETEHSFVSDSTFDPFPNNVMSLVAEGDVDLVGGNGSAYTMPVYAGGTFHLGNKSKLFGQVIADVFCTTNKPGECKQAGSPAEIFFVRTGENRAESFRAIAETGGIPTFTVESYELR